ncbi:MAG: metal-dependent transcriptional regulator [Chthonomonadaceae bacterium]|nr:metal-dependent transcriptional regulator [Chthonomonadaceae bacterium]
MSQRLARSFTQTEEDYLKAIFLTQERRQTVSTTLLSKQMGMTPAAVTKTLKNLAERNLISYVPYYGAHLTATGEKVALEVIRHHRLIELYLHEALGYSWDQVDAEAERLEHHISEEFEEKIEIALQFPLHDPHGHPIPTKDGTMPPYPGFPLEEARIGEAVTVSRVDDENPATLRSLSLFGIKLETKLQVKGQNEKTGAITLSVNADKSHEIELDMGTVKAIFVERDSPHQS